MPSVAPGIAAATPGSTCLRQHGHHCWGRSYSTASTFRPRGMSSIVRMRRRPGRAASTGPRHSGHTPASGTTSRRSIVTGAARRWPLWPTRAPGLPGRAFFLLGLSWIGIEPEGVCGPVLGTPTAASSAIRALAASITAQVASAPRSNARRAIAPVISPRNAATMTQPRPRRPCPRTINTHPLPPALLGTCSVALG